MRYNSIKVDFRYVLNLEKYMKNSMNLANLCFDRYLN